MWVRIRELSFAAEAADRVIRHFRDTAVARFDGQGHHGFRLLVDQQNGRALEVSYWTTEQDARAENEPQGASAFQVPGSTLERTNHYELAIDAA